VRATLSLRRAAWGLGFLLAVAGCGGSKHGGTGPVGNALLLEHNAQFNDGRTVRWPNLPIVVSLGGLATVDEVTAWTGATGGAVTFTFVSGPPPPNSIDIRGQGGTEFCAVTTVNYDSNGTITSADTRLSTAIFRGPQCVRTVTHEIGHAIGFLDHTANGGLMDPAGGHGQFTAEVTDTIRDLYFFPPGTAVAAEKPRVTELRSGGRRSVTITYYPVRR
jgi:hypothetical protein